LSSIVFGRLGDTRGRRRVVGIGFLLSALLYAAHLLIKDMGSLFLVRGLAGVTYGMIPGSLAALAWGTSIGLFTGLGSLGMMVANILDAFLKSDWLIFLAAALFSVVGFFLTFSVRENSRRIAVPRFPVKVILRNLNVYLPFLIRHSAAQAIWAVYPLYLYTLGATRFQIGMIYALNPLAQFLFMIALDRRKSVSLMKMGIFASAAAFLGFALATNLWVIFAFQVVLGYSWANLYMGSVKYLLENNIEQATANGILNSMIGLSGIIGPLVGGVVALLGLKTMLLASAGLACVAFFISLLMHRNQSINPSLSPFVKGG
jgi:MFS family permease